MDAKTTSWVSYLWWIGWIVSMATSNNLNPKPSLVTFHLRQSFGLLVISTGLWILNWFLMFSGIPGWYYIYMLLSITLFVFWIIGLIAAVQGEEKLVPVVGPSFQQWFQFIK